MSREQMAPLIITKADDRVLQAALGRAVGGYLPRAHVAAVDFALKLPVAQQVTVADLIYQHHMGSLDLLPRPVGSASASTSGVAAAAAARPVGRAAPRSAPAPAATAPAASATRACGLSAADEALLRQQKAGALQDLLVDLYGPAYNTYSKERALQFICSHENAAGIVQHLRKLAIEDLDEDDDEEEDDGPDEYEDDPAFMDDSEEPPPEKLDEIMAEVRALAAGRRK
jgi:hypothetical protein